MERINFNDNWTYKHLGNPGPGTPVTVPHDAMLSEKRRIQMNGVKIRTKSIHPAIIEVLVDTTAAGKKKKAAGSGRVEAVVSDGVRECRIEVNGREEYDA